MQSIQLKKGVRNWINFEYQGNLTDKTVTYRIKKKKEDETTPLVEDEVTISQTSTNNSTGSFVVDLTTLPDLIGECWIDFKIYPVDAPEEATYSTIFPIAIVTTLKA